MIPASAFDSKPKFLEKTRNAFGGGLFNISDANVRDIEAYYNYLKEDYYAGTPRAYYAVELIGRQKETGYWCLSKEVWALTWSNILFKSSLRFENYVKINGTCRYCHYEKLPSACSLATNPASYLNL